MMKIGRYNIISELGRGAMGIVYKASDPTIGREVALKVLSLNASSEEGTSSPQQMFMREVRAAGRLAHPSIVAIHDAFDDQENQTSCIVMELVPGVTLEKILDSGQPLTTEQALNLVRQIAEGLDYAHRNQVIHRDLKPANILVTRDGRAKITDFGIAKILAREGMARTIGVMGTPSYMSPEQVRGGQVDGRTDIFSLGIMIFTMLSGKKPFSGNTAAVMFKIVYEEPPAPSSLNPQLTLGTIMWLRNPWRKTATCGTPQRTNCWMTWMTFNTVVRPARRQWLQRVSPPPHHGRRQLRRRTGHLPCQFQAL